MGLLDYFRSKPKTANIAKQRLELLIAHEHDGGQSPDYLPRLQADILAVIRKYVEIEEDAVDMRIERSENCDMLELNVSLPEAETT